MDWMLRRVRKVSIPLFIDGNSGAFRHSFLAPFSAEPPTDLGDLVPPPPFFIDGKYSVCGLDAETGSTATVSATTQSDANRRFPVSDE